MTNASIILQISKILMKFEDSNKLPRRSVHKNVRIKCICTGAQRNVHMYVYTLCSRVCARIFSILFLVVLYYHKDPCFSRVKCCLVVNFLIYIYLNSWFEMLFVILFEMQILSRDFWRTLAYGFNQSDIDGVKS